MLSPSVLRMISILAPDKQVTIICGGKSYDLPPKPVSVPIEPPHPFEEVSKQMRERDAEIRALLTSVAERSDSALNQVREAVSAVALGQAEVVKSVAENTDALYQPVKPAYFKDGKIMHAQRVKK